jgi:hypothetical protein
MKQPLPLLFFRAVIAAKAGISVSKQEAGQPTESPAGAGTTRWEGQRQTP